MRLGPTPTFLLLAMADDAEFIAATGPWDAPGGASPPRNRCLNDTATTWIFEKTKCSIQFRMRKKYKKQGASARMFFLFLTLLCVRGLDPGRANDFGFLPKKEAEAWTRFMNFPGKMLYGCGPASELQTAVQMAKDMRN